MNIGHVNTPIAAESLALTGAPERCTGADMIWDTMRPNVSDTNRKECPQLKFVLNVTVIQVRCVLIKTAFVVFLLFVQFGGFLFKIHKQKALDEDEWVRRGCCSFAKYRNIFSENNTDNEENIATQCDTSNVFINRLLQALYR